MGTLALDTGCVDLEIYQLLGLKELKKGDSRTPRVLMLLSSLLERSIHRNEMLSETTDIEDIVTVFHGLRAPSVSIRQYIDRIFRYSGCSPSCFVVAQIYLDRFLRQTNVRLTSLNVHRLLITSIMLAAKFNDDAIFNNAYYAKVGGISTAELNRLELKFLFSIDFRLHVNANTFVSCCHQLEKEANEGLQIERPVQPCRVKKCWSNSDDSTPYAPTIAR